MKLLTAIALTPFVVFLDCLEDFVSETPFEPVMHRTKRLWKWV